MLRKLFYRLRASLLRGKIEGELERELRSHLEMETAENMRRGMSEEEARRAARRSFGGMEQVKEAYRDLSRFRWIEDLWQDARYGARMLWRSPNITLTAVLTLALGIGANSAIFSVVNAVLLRPLPYPNSDRIVTVSFYEANQTSVPVVGGNYFYWRERSKVIEQIAAYSSSTAVLTGNGEPARLRAGDVSADLFATLGVGPALGRAFKPEEDKPDGAPVVILSHGLWQRRFGGDPEVIGRAITLRGRSRTVIGIMPPGFQFPGDLDLWLPLALNVNQELGPGPSVMVYVIARLKPGVTTDAAVADLTAIVERGGQVIHNWRSDVRVRVIGLRERLIGDVRLALLVLFGAVAFVLLIACANVANLLLARASARQREMAIRAAVGAGRFRLVRQSLTESLLLSSAGGVAGLLLATWVVKLLVRMNPGGIARIEQSSVDGRALGFTCAVAALVGLLAGLFPALRASKTDVNETLKAQSDARSWGRGARRSLHALMIAEFALTLVLLIGAGLMIKSFLQLLAVPKGYDSNSVLTLFLSPSSAKYPLRSPQRIAYYRELHARIQALPGVQAASLASFLPLAGHYGRDTFQIEGRPPFEPGKEPMAQSNSISHDYFQTMGMRMRAGRAFTAQDGAEAPLVAIINETMARRFWPNENPVGGRFVGRPSYTTIVGVAPDTHPFGLDREVQPEIYLPYLQNPSYYMKLAVRVAPEHREAASTASLVSAIRNHVRAMDPDEPIHPVVTMDDRLSDSVAPRRFQTLLFGAFAALALVIATVGMYGVLSYAVSRRTHEIGVRMALGAQASDVLRLLIGQGMRLTLIGALLGLAAALALTRVIKNLLFNVKATDPETFALIALLLVAVALIACYIPARRATKVDPLIALRRE